MEQTVPVVLFAYSRADILREVLGSLKANNVPLLYLFSDGPRRPENAAAVMEVRQVLRSIDWCETVLHENSENRGLGQSILYGVTKVLQRHAAAIVIEDDLICVPGFYHYITTALLHYHNDSRVMSVTGWTHPRIIPTDVDSAPYFDGKSECWTWGTWRRAWAGMEQDALTLLRQCAAQQIDVEKYGSDLPKMAAEELTKNLWAVRWNYLHMSRRGLCLRPPYSMVEHLGFDQRATTSAGAFQWANPPLRACPKIPRSWPQPIENPQTSVLWRQAVGDL